MPSNIHPYIKRPHAAVSSTWSVPDLCRAYDFPTKAPGGGRIAIVEMGGGWSKSDLTAYFSSIGQPIPVVQDISVDGTKNSQQNPQNDADGEVALDIQVAGAAYHAATGKPASIDVFWSTDIASAVRAAVKHGCDVCSISWGADEREWGTTNVLDMETAASVGYSTGMAIFAAAGDNDSSDGGPTPANVDCPASCPHVIGCGGTSKPKSGPEVVWNNNPGNADGSGTGGGYSTVFTIPSWQLTRTPEHKMRMVPDVAANADPMTGYEIILYGEQVIVGGTSAVAPLYAGLCAAFGKKRGVLLPQRLWSHPQCFRDITEGDNGTFKASKGADPCTGLGVPIGKDLGLIF